MKKQQTKRLASSLTTASNNEFVEPPPKKNMKNNELDFNSSSLPSATTTTTNNGNHPTITVTANTPPPLNAIVVKSSSSSLENVTLNHHVGGKHHSDDGDCHHQIITMDKNSKNQIMSNLIIPSSCGSTSDCWEHDITQSPAFVVLKEIFSDSIEEEEDKLTTNSSYLKSASLESFTECILEDNTMMNDDSNCQQQLVENHVENQHSQSTIIESSPQLSHHRNLIGSTVPICKEIEPKDIKLNILNVKNSKRHVRILLVRHGQCVTNVHKTILQEKSDHSIPLSKAGEEQAKAAGVYIKRFYEDMNRRLWEKIQKEKLSYTDISKKKFQRELKFISNSETTQDFKFDNDEESESGSSSGEEEEGAAAVNNKSMITYPLRVRMWNSTYNRARETANIIMSEASNVIQDQRESILLVEQQFGLFEGVPLDELNKRFPQEFQHFEKHIGFFGRFYARPPLGESRFDVSKRVQLLFEKLYLDSETEGISDVIIVSHGVTVRAFTQMWLDLKPEWFDSEVNPNNCGIRFLDGNRDRGYCFNGFSLNHSPQPKTATQQ